MPRITLTEIVLDAPDAHALADFYRRLLGGSIGNVESDWVTLRPTEGEVTFAFASEPNYMAPTWPSDREQQQMMIHLDFLVEDLEEAVTHAVALGAHQATFQPQTDVRVMLDPAGHPFCLWVEP
jgi:catechol-2,3-dioxygenase